MGNWLAELRRRIVGAPAEAAQGAAGAQAEELAARLLAAHGLRLLARNVRCRGGEVDLIALDRETVVFVEVRLRRHRDFGGAASSIGRAKRRRVILAARYWLAGTGHAWAGRPCRFDAVLYSTLDPDSAQWLQGAFAADGYT
jgi:putative endonuclease